MSQFMFVNARSLKRSSKNASTIRSKTQAISLGQRIPGCIGKVKKINAKFVSQIFPFSILMSSWELKRGYVSRH